MSEHEDEHAEQAEREALGCLRAAARGDEASLEFCARSVTDPARVITALTTWFVAHIDAAGQYDAAQLFEHYASVSGLA